MIRRLLPVFLLLVTFTFAAQAQDNKAKATKKAAGITKYLNSKITSGAKITAAQTAKIVTAYEQYYDDYAAWKGKKKKFGEDVKAYKTEAKKPQKPEGIAKLKEMKKQLVADQRAIKKEQKEMPVRRDDKIKEALNVAQKAIFVQMRAEQSTGK